MTDLPDLPDDPYRPMGLVEVADLTDPWITVRQWRQWYARGVLPPARWTVDGRPVWAALDVASMLDEMQLHFPADGGAAHRCGRTCHACSEGDDPTTWSHYWHTLDAVVSTRR